MKPVALGIVTVLIAVSSVRAQELPPPPPGVSSQLQGLFGGVVSDKKPTGPLTPMTFKSTGKLLITDTVIGALKLDKAQEAEMRKFVPQLVGLIEQAYGESGFEKHDLAVALAGLLTTCHEIDTGTFKLDESDDAAQKEVEKKRLQAAVQQIRRAVGGVPGFAKVSDKDKQSAYELCTFQVGYLAVTWQQAGDDEEKKAAARQMARQLMTTLFNIDPDSIVQSKIGEFGPKPGYKLAEKTQKPDEPGPAPELPAVVRPALGASAEGAPIAPPAGWGVSASKGGFFYAPKGLGAGEVLGAYVAPLQSLGEKAIDAWLASAVSADPFGLGKAPPKLDIRSTSDNAASLSLSATGAGGSKLLIVYSAQTMDGQTVRLSALVATEKEGFFQKHQAGIQAVLGGLIAADKKAAVEENRGLKITKLPTDYPKWLTPGGALQAGIYVGNETYGDEQRAKLRLYLFPSGEYQLYKEDGSLISDHSTVNYNYNPRTGLLNMDWGSLHQMSNDKSDPNDDMCLIGKDAQGKPVVYARSDRGFNYSTTILRYAGPTDRPSPAEEKAAKAAAEAEEARYKWVSAPGKGIQTAQIHCLLLHSETTSFYNGSGMSVSTTYDPYILLKDGTIYNGLPVAPDDMDIARSRRQEPEKWGRWKKKADGRYAAAWPDFPAKFIDIQGEVVLPAPEDLRFIGRYGSGETSGSAMGSSFRLWGVTFTAEGRFKKDARGGYGSNPVYSSMPGGVSIHTGYDDDGSYVGASGENFALSNSDKKRPKSNRSGNYSVKGYTMTLKLDDGGVVRLPFFFSTRDRKAIWFEGAVLSKDDDKKK